MANISGASCEKATIEYPLLWEYKAVLQNEVSAKEKIENLLKNENFKIEFSKFSKGGKFISFKISVFVRDEKHKNAIFELLAKISKIVL